MNDINELKQNTNIIDIVSRYVSLKKDGIHEVGICPFHNDTHGSLKVTPSKQIFKCFACDTGGDVFDFVMKHDNVELPEAIKIIKNESISISKPTPIILEKPSDQWNYTTELPQSEPTFHHYKHGQPSHTYAYHNESGQIISYVCRFDFENGQKEVLPYSPVTDGTVVKWGWKGLPAPKSLYNLHLIKHNPKSVIVVVEGEKTADAGNANTDKFIFVTWQGGSKGIRHSNFTPLHGRKVLLWPDNDTEQREKDGSLKPFHLQPGNEAMYNISEIIGGKTALLKWIKNTKDLPNKWDCADKEWKPKELDKHVSVNLSDIPEVVTVIIEKPKPTPTHKENEYYRLLGYSKDAESKLAYFFYSFGSKTVIKLSPTSMSKANLQMLAPINYWEHNFAGSRGINLDAAQNQLIQLSHKVGPFRSKYIRGRGAWMDGNDLIIHTGENIIIQNKMMPLSEYESKYVYEINEDIEFGYKNPLTDNESKYILDGFSFPVWEREINSHLLAGWCVVSPFCGTLEWRPHVWITGPAGSSKSWIMDKMVQELMGDIGIQIQGKSTGSGISGLLQSDARPVLYDEADVDNQRDKDRVQDIIALARVSSSNDGGGIAKGTQTGGSRVTEARVCFALSSIGVQLDNQADKSRFTVLSLLKFEGVRTIKEFNDFSNNWFETVTPEYVRSLQARTIDLMPTIIKNAKVFENAVAEHIGNRRLGKQVGILLAGAYSLKSKELVNYEDALKFVSSKDWSEEKSLDNSKDELQLFNVIMSSTVRVDGNYERSIGELILIADSLIPAGQITISQAEDKLRRTGIVIDNGMICISNGSNEIRRIVRDTSWSNDYSKLLKRIDGAESLPARTYEYGVSRQRGTAIPIHLISDSTEKIITDSEYLSKIKAPY